MTITVIQPTRLHGADPLPRGTCLGQQNPDCTAPIHGTYSAYVTFRCRCPHAREASRVYHKRLREGRSARRLVDPTGARRRLRALCAIGWREQDMTPHLRLAQQNVHKLIRDSDRQISVITLARVEAMYARLSGTAGPSSITRKRAIAKGWAPPIAWEYVDIDDPDAQPSQGDANDQQDGYDPITVGLGVDGRLTWRQLDERRPDLIEVVRRLATRMNDQEIAHHLRVPGADDGPPGKTRGQNSVGQFRKRNRIPAPERYEAVYAYRPGGKRARSKAA